MTVLVRFLLVAFMALMVACSSDDATKLPGASSRGVQVDREHPSIAFACPPGYVSNPEQGNCAPGQGQGGDIPSNNDFGYVYPPYRPVSCNSAAQCCAVLGPENDPGCTTSDPGAYPQPNLTVSEDNACPGGYVLSFLSSSGAAYCENDGSNLPTASAAAYTLMDVYKLYYQDGHYWNRHLACYLDKTYSNQQFDQVVYQDFGQQAVDANNLPEPYKRYTGLNKLTDNNGVQTQYQYGAYNLGTAPVIFMGVAVDYTSINIGTAFLTNPRRRDCP